MRRNRKKKNELFALFFMLIFLSGFFTGRFYAHTFEPIEKIREKTVKVYVPLEKKHYNTSSIYLLAINSEGKGEAIPLTVEVRPGTGKVLANIDNLLFWIDTQESIQIARDWAARIAGRDPSTFDVIYTIDTNASVVGGPSAGAAFVIATIAALKNVTLNNSVLITGTIQRDGSIGEVGGIYEKGEAAKEVGASTFLVPKGQGTEIKFIPVERCTNIRPGFTFCEIEYKKKKINISEKIGIRVAEVGNITEAVRYFFGDFA